MDGNRLDTTGGIQTSGTMRAAGRQGKQMDQLLPREDEAGIAERAGRTMDIHRPAAPEGKGQTAPEKTTPERLFVVRVYLPARAEQPGSSSLV